MIHLYQDECTKAAKSITQEPRPHGLIATGFGDQIYTVADTEYKGKIWLWEQMDVENGFRDGILVTQAVEKFQTLLQDFQWAVTTMRRLGSLHEGDTIKFHPTREDAIELPVITIERNSDGELSLELGARMPSRSDAWEAEQGISSGYTNKYMTSSHADIEGQSTNEDDDTRLFYPGDPAHISDGGTIEFWVPGNVLDTDLRPKLTMDVSIDPESNESLYFGACALQFKMGGLHVRGGNIIGWTPGSEVKEIDVTSWLTGQSTALFSGLSSAAALTGWPTGSVKVEVVVSTRTGHTDTIGSIMLKQGVTDETITIDGPGTYTFETKWTALPGISCPDGLDCYLKIFAVIVNTLSVEVVMANEYEEAHGSYEEHPRLNINATLHCWKRQDR